MLRNNFNGIYENRGASPTRPQNRAGGNDAGRPLAKGRGTAPVFLFSALLAILALTALPLQAQDFSEGFGTDTESSSSAETSPRLEWNGFVSSTMRSYIDTDNPAVGKINTYPEVGLDLTYYGDNSEAVANLRFHRNWEYNPDPQASDHQNALWYLQQMIDQAYLRLYYNNFNLQTGYLKEVWGTGDQVHVVDPLNPVDYYDFVNVDYIDRKTAEFMFKLNIPFGMNGLVELAYVPTFTPDSFPLTGRWAPAQMQPIRDALEAEAELHQPEMNSLGDGQYAARVSDTLGGVDLGETYYYGFLKQPNIDINIVDSEIDLSYDRVHVFGLDAAGVPAGFNLRVEAAYYLTEDYDGTDETRLNNHSVQWVAGFDRNLPVSELNLNIQTIGAYYLNEDDEPASNIISAALSDSWNNNKINPEVSVSYGIEEEDWMIRPEVSFDLIDDAQLTAGSAVFIGDSEGRFGQFDDNGFDNNYAQVEFTYNF